MPYKNKQDLYKNQMARWTKRKLKAIEYKGGKCKLCSYDKYHGALHFHHIDSTLKTGVWTKIRLWSWDKIIKELDNCDLLCANCHAETHALSC